jgi:hypothetical protein
MFRRFLFLLLISTEFLFSCGHSHEKKEFKNNSLNRSNILISQGQASSINIQENQVCGDFAHAPGTRVLTYHYNNNQTDFAYAVEVGDFDTFHDLESGIMSHSFVGYFASRVDADQNDFVGSGIKYAAELDLITNAINIDSNNINFKFSDQKIELSTVLPKNKASSSEFLKTKNDYKFLLDRMITIQNKFSAGDYKSSYLDLLNISSYIANLSNLSLNNFSVNEVTTAYKNILKSYFTDGVFNSIDMKVLPKFETPITTLDGASLRQSLNICFIYSQNCKLDIIPYLIVIDYFFPDLGSYSYNLIYQSIQNKDSNNIIRIVQKMAAKKCSSKKFQDFMNLYNATLEQNKNDWVLKYAHKIQIDLDIESDEYNKNVTDIIAKLIKA